MGLDKNFNTAGANEMELAGGGLTSATLSNCLKEGKPLADTGELYSTIQDAENAASSWVFVPPGTFTEQVDIDTDGISIIGSGYGSFIDADTIGDCFTINADDVTISNLRLFANDIYIRIGNSTAANGGKITNCFFGPENSGDANGARGIDASTNTANNWIVRNCYAQYLGGFLAWTGSNANRWVVDSNIVFEPTADALNTNYGEDIVASNNNIVMAGSNNSIGIKIYGSDQIVIGNRVHNAGNDGIKVTGDGFDCIVANNRVSNSGGTDINNGGSGTITDGNLTGGAN